MNLLMVKTWLACLQEHPDAKLRLFCFPYAGGSAAVFKGWDRALPEVEVYAIQPPGRGARMKEPPFSKLQPYLDALLPELIPYLDRPFAFFGHSLGATVSFELTRRLREEMGLSPVHLFVSGARGPEQAPQYVHLLTDAELLDILRSFDGFPQPFLENPDWMRSMLPTIRADFSLLGTYNYQEAAPLTCPITAFGGVDDPHVQRTHLAEWAKYTRGPFQIREFLGGHFYLNQESRTALLEQLNRELKRPMSH